tara:strand:- start:390 stop:635 length:246 start_codon:yes stop_codon:yes gene_type:complete
MATTTQKILAIARRVLEERGAMPASAIAEVVNCETRDGIHVNRMHTLLTKAKDIEKKPFSREPIEWRLKENLDAVEDSGPI